MRTIEDTGLPVELVEDDLVSALETHDAIVAAIKRLLVHVRATQPAAESLEASRKKVLIVA